MDRYPNRQTKGAELYEPADGKAVRGVPQKPEYTLSEPKPTKMDPYKQIVDEWLEEAPYSALRILEKPQEMGFDGGCSIVKAYANSRKMDLNEKAEWAQPLFFQPLKGNLVGGRVDFAINLIAPGYGLSI